jgi:phosphoribosylamine--glycine ligase
MKILVIGGGAREHALVWKLAAEQGVSEVLCAPGNPGIAGVGRCIASDVTNTKGLLEIAIREKVDLTVVGPELPLSLGIVDVFTANGCAIVGPTKNAAALESSKAFAKDFMHRHRVPTARFEICDSAAAAQAVIASGALGYPHPISSLPTAPPFFRCHLRRITSGSSTAIVVRILEAWARSRRHLA